MNNHVASFALEKENGSNHKTSVLHQLNTRLDLWQLLEAQNHRKLPNSRKLLHSVLLIYTWRPKQTQKLDEDPVVCAAMAPGRSVKRDGGCVVPFLRLTARVLH